MIWKHRRPKPQRSDIGLPDTLVPWLLAVLTLTIMPHLLRLPWWLSGLFILAVVWRWLAAQHGWALPNRWWLLLLTLLSIAALILQFGTLLGRAAGVALLAAMAAMKVLETRNQRDAMVLIHLAYFLLIAHLLYSQSLLSCAFILLSVLGLIAVQLPIQQPQSSLKPQECLRLGGGLMLQALPAMLILFILFPRLPGPLWGLPKDAYSGLTGLSNTMSPGSISELILSGEVAFRVRFEQAIPPSENLYWRGPVLWWYRNRTWSALEEPAAPRLPYTVSGERMDYSIMLEPHGKHWLFALDVPAYAPSQSWITNTFQLKRRKPVNERLQYQMSSYLSYQALGLSKIEKRRFLQLPAQGNLQARALAQDWRTNNPSDRAVVNQALSFFRQQPFYYTLTPPLLGENSIDEFVFSTRRGFCEHYAGSFVFMMRVVGIPARVVLGYQGGERNGDYFIVRQSDAHAWAEVWLQGQGWRRVDPTAAVAPERVERGLYAALDNSANLPLLARGDHSWLRQLALSWDAINNAWNEWVIAYDTERQQQFLSGLGFGPVDWRTMTWVMVVAMTGIALVAAGWYALRRWRAHDPLARIYQRFCDQLARQGLPRQPHEGPLAFAERIAQRWPDAAQQARQIGRLYAALRYGSGIMPNRHNMAQLSRMTRTFKTRV